VGCCLDDLQYCDSDGDARDEGMTVRSDEGACLVLLNARNVIVEVASLINGWS